MLKICRVINFVMALMFCGGHGGDDPGGGSRGAGDGDDFGGIL